MNQLYTAIRESNTEILKEHRASIDEMLRKQDEKIDKMSEMYTGMVDRIGTALDSGAFGGKKYPTASKTRTRSRKGKERGRMDVDSDGRDGEGDGRGNETDGEGDTRDSVGTEGGDESEPSPFSWASKKRKPVKKSHIVKHVLRDELDEKVWHLRLVWKTLLIPYFQTKFREWFSEIMQGQNPLQNTVSDGEAADFAKIYKVDPFARPCTPDSFRYWIDGTPRAAWNKAAAYVFVELLEIKQFISKPDQDMRELYAEAFILRLRSLRGDYLKSLLSEEEQDLHVKANSIATRKSTVCFSACLNANCL